MAYETLLVVLTAALIVVLAVWISNHWLLIRPLKRKRKQKIEAAAGDPAQHGESQIPVGMHKDMSEVMEDLEDLETPAALRVQAATEEALAPDALPQTQPKQESSDSKNATRRSWWPWHKAKKSKKHQEQESHAANASAPHESAQPELEHSHADSFNELDEIHHSEADLMMCSRPMQPSQQPQRQRLSPTLLLSRAGCHLHPLHT